MNDNVNTQSASSILDFLKRLKSALPCQTMCIVNQRQRRKLEPQKWRIFVKFSNPFFSKGRILGIYFLMNLPLTNKL